VPWVLYGCNVAKWSQQRKQVREALNDADAARLKVALAGHLHEEKESL
jgi:hypothetical protein